jgi:hypothetical protein
MYAIISLKTSWGSVKTTTIHNHSPFLRYFCFGNNMIWDEHPLARPILKDKALRIDYHTSSFLEYGFHRLMESLFWFYGLCHYCLTTIPLPPLHTQGQPSELASILFPPWTRCLFVVLLWRINHFLGSFAGLFCPQVWLRQFSASFCLLQSLSFAPFIAYLQMKSRGDVLYPILGGKQRLRYFIYNASERHKLFQCL